MTWVVVKSKWLAINHPLVVYMERDRSWGLGISYEACPINSYYGIGFKENDDGKVVMQQKFFVQAHDLMFLILCFRLTITFSKRTEVQS